MKGLIVGKGAVMTGKCTGRLVGIISEGTKNKSCLNILTCVFTLHIQRFQAIPKISQLCCGNDLES